MPPSSFPGSAGSDSYVVIPARLASTRLPRKLLLAETGQPLIVHTLAAASSARRPSGVCVATDSRQIAEVVRRAGAEAVMTDSQLASGTDRVAAVARDMPHVQIVVNVQGDEPEISGNDIDQAILLLEQNPDAVMSTLATPIRDAQLLDDPACVKVVLDDAGCALYFSRAAIPRATQGREDLLRHDPPCFYQHIGLYAYRRDFLLQMAAMPRSTLERIENLEQLRVLQAGHQIAVGVLPRAAVGIDTLEDYQAFVRRHRRAVA